MNLYHWHSNALSNYSSGDIIVMAETVEQARAKAREQFETWNETDDSAKFNWMFYVPKSDWNEDDFEEWNEIMTKLDKDLTKEPTLVSMGCVFVRGSE